MNGLRIIHLDRWWSGKLVQLVTVAALASHAAGSPSGDVGRLVLFLVSAVAIAAFGHLVNDLADREVDRVAGKSNLMAERSFAERTALVSASLVAGLVPWAFIDARPLALVLLAVQLALLVGYSVPPVRWKARGWLGAGADAAYAYAVPMVWTVVVFAPEGPLPILVLATLAVWSSAVGLRGILWHQLEDVEADRAAGVRTVAVRLGARRTERVLAAVLLPLELVAGAALVALVAASGAGWIVPFVVGYVAWRAFQLRYLFDPPVQLRGVGARARVRVVGFVFVDELVERWLPVVAAASVALDRPAWWLVVVVVLVGFDNGPRRLVATDARHVPDAAMRMLVDARVWAAWMASSVRRRRQVGGRPRPVSAELVARRRFVFVVCGAEEHLATLDRALDHLRRFTRLEVWVVTDPARNDRPVGTRHADQVVEVRTPVELDHHQASIWLKTSLPRHLPEGEWCYLDTDVLAVRPGVEAVFDARMDPVAFASDHTYPDQSVDCFSPWAMSCGCVELTDSCDHLRLALRDRLGVEVPGDWLHWNGGVFVFGPEGHGFMEQWHRWAVASFSWPEWQTRDQGTLIATAWHLGLERAARLPGAFNFIVDLENHDLRYDADRGWAHRPEGPWWQPRFLHLYTSPLHDPRWRLGRDTERAVLRLSALRRHEERKGAIKRWCVEAVKWFYWRVLNPIYWRVLNPIYSQVLTRLAWWTYRGAHWVYWTCRKGVELVVHKGRSQLRRLRPSRVAAKVRRARSAGSPGARR